MTVVSNTSPLCYLLLIEQIDILPALLKTMFIPEAVINELQQKGEQEAILLAEQRSSDLMLLDEKKKPPGTLLSNAGCL